jgi:hypothetical protein
VAPLGVQAGTELLLLGVMARPSRLSELLSATGRAPAEIAIELERLQRLKAMLAAYEAELVD